MDWSSFLNKELVSLLDFSSLVSHTAMPIPVGVGVFVPTPILEVWALRRLVVCWGYLFPS